MSLAQSVPSPSRLTVKHYVLWRLRLKSCQTICPKVPIDLTQQGVSVVAVSGLTIRCSFLAGSCCRDLVIFLVGPRSARQEIQPHKFLRILFLPRTLNHKPNRQAQSSEPQKAQSSEPQRAEDLSLQSSTGLQAAHAWFQSGTPNALLRIPELRLSAELSCDNPRGCSEASDTSVPCKEPAAEREKTPWIADAV